VEQWGVKLCVILNTRGSQEVTTHFPMEILEKSSGNNNRGCSDTSKDCRHTDCRHTDCRHTDCRHTDQNCLYWLGRNDKENDVLLSTSHQNDWWLHLSKGPSPHGILRCACSSSAGDKRRCIREVCAEIKAHSKQAGARKVSVDVYMRKNVKSLKNEKAGLVELKKKPDHVMIV
jgi:hypothetical protein